MIGKLVISENAVAQIVTYVVIKISGVTQVNKVIVEMLEEGVTVRIEVSARYGTFLPELAREVQRNIRRQLEGLTGLVVYGTHVVLKSIEL
jgi:uncharacterized alkaline shock family protein YloU